MINRLSDRIGSTAALGLQRRRILKPRFLHPFSAPFSLFLRPLPTPSPLPYVAAPPYRRNICNIRVSYTRAEDTRKATVDGSAPVPIDDNDNRPGYSILFLSPPPPVAVLFHVPFPFSVARNRLRWNSREMIDPESVLSGEVRTILFVASFVIFDDYDGTCHLRVIQIPLSLCIPDSTRVIQNKSNQINSNTRSSKLYCYQFLKLHVVSNRISFAVALIFDTNFKQFTNLIY